MEGVREDAIEVGERLPADPTRFVATVRWLTRLEEQTEIDPVPIIELLSEVGRSDPGSGLTFETADVMRALERERALMHSNADGDRRGGRPSKVDQLAKEITITVRLSADGQFEHEANTGLRD